MQDNQRRTRSKKPRSPKKKLLVFGFTSLVFWAYFRLVGKILSTKPQYGSETGQIRPGNQKPPLHNFVQGWNITGNVSWMLDFSIVGFPKTGTSTLMLYLEQHRESVFIFDEERCEMGWNQQVKLIGDLYKHYQTHRRIGIKCPRDLEINLSLDNYREFFPTTKFIVGLRHPVSWFQSFYNFRVTNEFPMPPAQKLIGKCRPFTQGVCTYRANFSQHLENIEPARKVFLYNVDQLRDNNTIRADRFRQDLGEFLGVPQPLDQPMIWIKPGQKGISTQKAKEIDALKINICEDQYKSLRKVLMKKASYSATWLQDIFLAQSNVRASSPEYFKDLLKSWNEDPCINADSIK